MAVWGATELDENRLRGHWGMKMATSTTLSRSKSICLHDLLDKVGSNIVLSQLLGHMLTGREQNLCATFHLHDWGLLKLLHG